MIEYAHAKINLSLDIVRKRPDGYHELESIFLPLQLHDTLEITASDNNIILCDEPGIPTDSSNLVWKAMELIQKKYQISQCFQVKLHKRIPSMAGLGGGSSDAAATLRALNTLLELHLPMSELINLAKQLGADVPFFLEQKPAIVRGIGEKLEELDFPFDLPVLLVKPSQGISTKEAYETLRLPLCAHPDTSEIIKAIYDQDYDAMASLLGNSLEESAFRLVPELLVIKEELQSMGFDVVLMSGSGTTMFAISKDYDLIRDAFDKFSNKGILSLITNIKREEWFTLI